MTQVAQIAAKLRIKRYSEIKYFLDLFIWVLAAPLSFVLRLDGSISEYKLEILIYSLIGLLIKAAAIASFKLQRQSWHKVGVYDLYKLLRAVGLVMLALLAFAFLITPLFNIPRSIPFLEALLALCALGGARLFFRLFYQRTHITAGKKAQRRVLIIGAGEAGAMIGHEIGRHPEAVLQPVGYLDDDPSKHSQFFYGIPVLGKIDDLPRIVKEKQIDEIIIAMPSAPGSVIRKVVELAQQAEVHSRIMPGIYDLLSGKVAIAKIRDVDVEDLLKREPIKLDLEEIRAFIAGRVVLVTGAGGSIGSEIVRQVAQYHPARLILLDRDENSLYLLERELSDAEISFTGIVCDIQRLNKLERVFEQHRPQVVFHAAANKHVPVMETDPDEAILNNVGGTRNMVTLALKYGVERFVNISTDKAINPSSVMGASKRVTEFLVEHAASRAEPGRCFVSVRFGNVLGSRGSVVPIFKEQIRKGGPVTLTHPDMTRYFMSIPEAVQIVLQAAGLGDNGAVYVLDMGEPVKIIDLARDLIRLSGFEPEVDIPIVYVGMRPGEKLFEVILSPIERTNVTKHDKIYYALKNNKPEDQFEGLLEDLFAAAHAGDGEGIRRALKELVPTAELSNNNTG